MVTYFDENKTTQNNSPADILSVLPVLMHAISFTHSRDMAVSLHLVTSFSRSHVTDGIFNNGVFHILPGLAPLSQNVHRHYIHGLSLSLEFCS